MGKTFLPRDTEAVEVSDLQAPGRVSRERPRLVKHQELPTRCEGTASYQYTEAVAEKYRPIEGERIIERLPEEGPMPQPSVGMRLSKWPDTEKNPKDELQLPNMAVTDHDICLTSKYVKLSTKFFCALQPLPASC